MTCRYDECPNRAHFNVENEYVGLYCEIHKKENMTDVFLRRCLAICKDGKNCPYNSKYNGYCGIHLSHDKTKKAGELFKQKKEKKKNRKLEKEKSEEEKTIRLETKNKQIEESQSAEEIKSDIEKICKENGIIIPQEPYNDFQKKLMIVTNPELILEWDFELNKSLNINLITHGSGHLAYWKCPKHGSYLKHVSKRTKIRKNGKTVGCKKCYQDSRRKFDKSEIESAKEKQKGKNKIYKYTSQKD